MLPVQWKASLLPFKHACDQITHTLAHTHAHSDCALVHAYYSYIYRSLMSRHARTLTAKAPHMQTHCSAPLSLSVTECVCVCRLQNEKRLIVYILFYAHSHTHTDTHSYTRSNQLHGVGCVTPRHPSITGTYLCLFLFLHRSLSLCLSHSLSLFDLCHSQLHVYPAGTRARRFA